MTWWQRLRNNDRLETQLDAELRYHFERQVADRVGQGVPEEEARRTVRIDFGGLDQAKESCRDARGTLWVEGILQDMKLALRTLRRSPGFALAAIGTLALGIGANTGIFSAVHAVLLKPLPYFQPDQLFMAQVEIPERFQSFGYLGGTIQKYREWRQADTVFAGVAALTPAEWNLTGTGEPERAGGAVVSTNFFSFLGVPIAHGRGFLPEEEQPGQDKVVVISDGLWRRRYGADPAIIGKSIDLNGESHVIVGIASPGLLVPTGNLLYLHFSSRIDVWKPSAPTKEELDPEHENWSQALLLRLKPGENLERGRQQLYALLNATPGPDKLLMIPHLVPIRDIYTGKMRLRLLLLLGASALLLLIACVNIANLFLARVARRSTEFATRIALGAGRTRIVGHMLAESTLLAAIGGAVGFAIAYATLHLLIAYGPADSGLLAGAQLDLPVLMFATLTSLLTGVLCAVFPALQAYRRDTGMALQEATRDSLGGRRAARFRQVLVGVEMALGTALLACAGLLLHSFAKVMEVDRGYEVDRVLAVDLELSGEHYSKGEQQVAFFRDLTENIRTIPGILAAGAISDPPVSGDSSSQVVFLATDIDDDKVMLQRPIAGYREVTPGYLAASGSALLTGRFFADTDPVTTALVSESLAQRLWPGEALTSVPGRAIRQGRFRGPVTVLGVVRDVRPGAVDREMLPQVYRPFLPPRTDQRMTLVVRASQDAAALAPAIRAQIRRLDSSLPIPAIRTMQEMVTSTVSERRFQMIMTGLFALISLLLGAVGIYGVVSYAVACRTREIGLRMALGARRGEVMRWVFARGLPPVLIGLLAGTAGAVMLATTLRSLLFGITPSDPLALVAVIAVLLFTAALACYVPARRASRLDPMLALRHE